MLFRLAPGAARIRLLGSIPRELTATAVFGGPPSVAHIEALLRGVEARAATIDTPLDVAVIGVPATTPYLPRERPNPVLTAYLALGFALRLWRDRFPLNDGGTVILAARAAGDLASTVVNNTGLIQAATISPPSAKGCSSSAIRMAPTRTCVCSIRSAWPFTMGE